MKIGVDYYPKQWDRNMWENDADLMKKIGVDVVRIADFAWCRLEPTENHFDFEWLDSIIDIFAQRNIDIVLCTPTNCPPLWLCKKYPNAVQTGKDGTKIATGIRGHRCYNNYDFLRLSERLIDKMSARYADNKSLITWQIDNELEANFCMCDDCTNAYRLWLKSKYNTLDNINHAYGNVVWSGEYSSWKQIKPPLGNYPHAWLNPTYTLDFNRYASDSTIKYISRQVDIIRKNSPNKEITTNTWFCENMADFYGMYKELDFVSFDNYPSVKIPANEEDLYSHSFHLDLMRGIKEKNFWIMEQLGGMTGSWMPMSTTTKPNMIKGYALQAYAHGADTILLFRWRTACKGAEMHWHGIIGHDNRLGRRFKEFESLCKTSKEIEYSHHTTIHSEIAVIYSSQDEWAFKIQPQVEGMYYV